MHVLRATYIGGSGWPSAAKAPRSSGMFYDHSTCMYYEQRTSGVWGPKAPPYFMHAL